jgi:hypothetical protein
MDQLFVCYRCGNKYSHKKNLISHIKKCKIRKSSKHIDSIEYLRIKILVGEDNYVIQLTKNSKIIDLRHEIVKYELLGLNDINNFIIKLDNFIVLDDCMVLIENDVFQIVPKFNFNNSQININNLSSISQKSISLDLLSESENKNLKVENESIIMQNKNKTMSEFDLSNFIQKKFSEQFGKSKMKQKMNI